MATRSERERELEKLRATIENAKNVMLHYEMWEAHGREHATVEYRREMEAGLATAQREYEVATAALEALQKTGK